MTAETDAMRLMPDDHAVIKRCVERQPKLYVRGQHEGYYVHSDIADLIDIIGRLAAAPAVQPAAGREALSKIIRQRLLGVAPDDQDVVLEDDDWRLILAALSAPQAAPGD